MQNNPQNSKALQILVAEDHPAHQYLIRTALEKAGHQVIVVGDGKQAVQAAANIQSLDLILMDIQMPEMDGPAAIRAIRTLHGAAAKVPIFILSADPGHLEFSDMLNQGADDFLAKPLDVQQMMGALAKITAPL